jgi:CRP-like cAMP-binding protein
MSLGAGEYFGELSILFSMRRAATVKTRTNAKLLSLSKAGLSLALKDHEKEAKMIHREARRRSAEHAAEEAAKRRVERREHSSRLAQQ